MSPESPLTKDDLLRAFEQQDLASDAYWNAFDTAVFFQKIGSSWSPGETVRHLTKSTRGVLRGLTMPRLVLRLMFGAPRRSSMTYDEFRDRYLKALSEGGRAGRFGPSDRREDDLDAWRKSIMTEFDRVNRELRTAIARWPDDKLDRLQLPHPLVGKLTVREMLFFTLYHQRHHIDVVSRRLREAQSIPNGDAARSPRR